MNNLEHSIHETRHTFATLSTVYGLDKTAIKKILGHVSKMELHEKTYTHLEIKYLLTEINKIK